MHTRTTWTGSLGAYFGLRRDATPGWTGRCGGSTASNWKREDQGPLCTPEVRSVSSGTRSLSPHSEAGRSDEPFGVTTLEDKIVPGATVEVRSQITEADFLGLSYGFRPGRAT